MTPATYAEELRKRNQMLKGQQPMPPQGMTPNQAGPAPQMSPVKQQALGNAPANPYGLSPEKMAAMSNDTSAEEAKIKSQMDYANSLRETKSAGPRQLGNVVVNNPWEGLEVGFNRALGGYLSGKADKKLDALDEQNDAKAAALVDVETSKYGAERSDADRTYDQVVRKQDRTEEVEDRAVVGDKVTYEDSEGQKYTGYWRDDPTDGSTQFYSNGLPIDVSGMREYVDPKSNGYNSNTMKGRTVFQNADGDDIQVAWRNGEAVNPITGIRLSEEEQEMLTSGEYFEMAPITESGLASGLAKFDKETKGIRKVANSYSNMLQVFADNGIDISTDNPLGWLEKGQGFLPDIVRLASDDKGLVYSAIKGVLNPKVREAAGMSQTVAEIERINDEYGDSVYKDPVIMGEALRRLGASIEQDIKEAKAGTAPSILNQYSHNLENIPNASDWTSWTYLDQIDDAFETAASNPTQGASSFTGKNFKNVQGRRGLSGRNRNKGPKLDDPLGLGKDRSDYTDDELYELLSSLRN